MCLSFSLSCQFKALKDRTASFTDKPLSEWARNDPQDILLDSTHSRQETSTQINREEGSTKTKHFLLLGE